MAKLDDQIAQVAIAIGGRNRHTIDQTAAQVAASLKPKEIVKLPDRWYPSFSAKKAGSPDLHDPWDLLWFEAITELLFQRKAEGLPGLIVLWERDDSTYHQSVVVALLRLAADGLEPEAILERLRRRFQTLHYVKTRECVRDVTYWKTNDPRPLELLRQFADIECPRSDGDTIGLYLNQMSGEFDVHTARKKAQAK